MMLLFFLAMFFVVESIIEKKRPPLGHTTGIIVLSGMLVSFIIYKILQHNSEAEIVMQDLKFDEEIFFDLILPLIIFPSGFNMRRKKFFRNIGTIMKFGFVGTLFAFAIYTAMAYGLL